MHTPPGARRPELKIGDAGFGLSAGGPAERVDPQQLAGQRRRRPAAAPPTPVATSSALRPSVASAPPLSRPPRGIPVSTGFGSSPGARRSTRLSVSGGGVGVDQPVFGVSGGEHQAGQAAAAARCRPAPSSPAPGRSRAAPAAPVRWSARRRARCARRAAPRPRRPARGRWRPPAGRGRCSPPARPWRTGRSPAAGPAASLGRTGSGTSGGPPSSPAPSTFSRQSRGPASGNVAQPASARTSATPATARRTRPIIGSTLEPGG